MGKAKASTLSLTVLVTIEMMNALNALSEECSLLVVPPHRNMYLVGAIAASFLAHFAILYIPFLASIFSVCPLGWREWKIVLAFSFILFSKFGEEFAKGGLLPPGIAVWIPNIIYSFIAFYLYKKAPK